MNYGEEYKDMEFHIDNIQHLDWEVLIELHEKYSILVNTFINNEIKPTDDIIETHKALEARLIACEISPIGYGYQPIFDQEI